VDRSVVLVDRSIIAGYVPVGVLVYRIGEPVRSVCTGLAVAKFSRGST
jgi:hypothetical protein